MIGSYLQILQDSLAKKLGLLIQLEDKSRAQSELLKEAELDFKAVDSNMDEKAVLIQEILKLDDGFESLYQRIKEQLLLNKEQYKTEISILKSLISQITDKNASIQALEARNKAEMDLYFSKQKRGIQSRKNAMSVARDYYQNMNKVKHVSPQFLDQKK